MSDDLEKQASGHLKLDDLLADLSDDGVLESSGNFTLDPSKAEEKLRGFALAHQHDYILKVVQCATAAGADRIAIKATPGELEVSFRGRPFQLQELKDMVAHLLADQIAPEHRHIRHLAAAMRGAVGIAPSEVKFRVWNGESGFQRRWNEEGWCLESLQSRETQPFHQFIVKRRLSQRFDSAVSELGAFFRGKSYTEEERHIAEHCTRCPIPLVLDGKELEALPFGQVRYPGYDISEDPNPGETKPPPYMDSSSFVDGFYQPQHHLAEACYPALEGAPTSLPNLPSEATLRFGLSPGEAKNCRAWLAIRAELGEPKLVIVTDGVTVSEQSLPGFCPGFLAVLAGEVFRTDLTGLKIVEDQFYHEQIQWLRKMSEELRASILQSPHLFPNHQGLAEAL